MTVELQKEQQVVYTIQMLYSRSPEGIALRFTRPYLILNLWYKNAWHSHTLSKYRGASFYRIWWAPFICIAQSINKGLN